MNTISNLISNPYFLPIAEAAAIGIVFVICLVLFLLLKRRIRRLEAKIAEKAELADQFNGLANELNQIRASVEEREQPKSPWADWSTEPASVHLNRRGQVLRLHRRGDSCSEIASSLGLSYGEVKLIIKIHNMAGRELPAEKMPRRTLIPHRIFDTDTEGHR